MHFYAQNWMILIIRSDYLFIVGSNLNQGVDVFLNSKLKHYQPNQKNHNIIIFIVNCNKD